MFSRRNGTQNALPDVTFIPERLTPMSKTICLLGALDTKGPEYAFVKERIEEQGLETFIIDVGVLGEPELTPDLSRQEVAKAAGADSTSQTKKRRAG